MRPSIQELNKKVWYRLFNVIAIIILFLAFIAPWIFKSSEYIFFVSFIIGGLINVIFWLVVIFFIRGAILYVLYGPVRITSTQGRVHQEFDLEETKNVREGERNVFKGFVLVLIFLLILLSVSILYASIS